LPNEAIITFSLSSTLPSKARSSSPSASFCSCARASSEFFWFAAMRSTTCLRCAVSPAIAISMMRREFARTYTCIVSAASSFAASTSAICDTLALKRSNIKRLPLAIATSNTSTTANPAPSRWPMLIRFNNPCMFKLP